MLLTLLAHAALGKDLDVSFSAPGLDPDAEWNLADDELDGRRVLEVRAADGTAWKLRVDVQSWSREGDVIANVELAQRGPDVEKVRALRFRFAEGETTTIGMDEAGHPIELALTANPSPAEEVELRFQAPGMTAEAKWRVPLDALGEPLEVVDPDGVRWEVDVDVEDAHDGTLIARVYVFRQLRAKRPLEIVSRSTLWFTRDEPGRLVVGRRGHELSIGLRVAG